jgi:hypothetical protein
MRPAACCRYSGAMRDDVIAALSTVRQRATHLPLVTAAAVAAVLLTAIRYGVFTHELALETAFEYGFSGRELSMGRWSTLLTSQLLSRDAFMAVSIVLSLILMLGLYEAVAGSARALLVGVTSAVAGPLVVAAVLGLGSSLGNTFAGQTLSTLDYGASAVTAGAGGALIAVLGMRRLRWFAIFWVVAGLLVHRQLADWEHLVSFTFGFGLGTLMGTPAPRPSRPGSRSRNRLSSWARFAVVLVVGFGAITGSAVAWATLPAPRSAVHLAGTRGTVQPARVISVSYPSPALGGRRSAFVVLPPGYDASRSRYPVVELLHGEPGSPAALETLPGVPPFIAIAPDGRGPVAEDGAFADTTKQRLGAAVSDDLRTWADAVFRTNGHWSVGGISSGGFGAAYLGSRTPGHYDAVCSLSGNFTSVGPAFRGEGQQARRRASPLFLTRHDGPRTLLITGVSDHASQVEATRYATALARVGQMHRLVLAPGGHDWALWRAQFPECLRFMLGVG